MPAQLDVMSRDHEPRAAELPACVVYICAKIVAVSVGIHSLMLRHSALLVFTGTRVLHVACVTPWTARGRVLGCMRRVAADMRRSINPIL